MSEEATAEIVEDEPTEQALIIAPTDAITEFGHDEVGFERARRIANALDSIIQEKGLAVAIGSNEHLRVEAWCACASMVGVSPRTVWVRRIPEAGTLEGYIARVEVVQMSTGQVIGAAEAGCFTDERVGGGPRWKEQHAVMSMAQTRATSKSIGQVLRWIPVLAGYSGTPYEEATAQMMESTPEPEPKRERRRTQQSPPRRRPITEKQKKLLFARSMKRAEALIDECAEAERPLKYGDAMALRGSIGKHAMIAVGCDAGEIYDDEIDPLLDAFEKAEIDSEGNVVIPKEPF